MKIINALVSKVKNNKVIKAGIGFTIASLLLRAIGFLTTPIFSRLMDPSEYGIFNTYLAYEGIFYIFIGLALHSSIQNAKYEFKGKLDEYVSSIILIDFGSLAVWLLIFFTFQNQLANLFHFDKIIIIVLILHSFSSAIMQVLSSRCAVDYNYKTYMYISLINAIGNVVISAILILTVCSNRKDIGRIFGNFLPVFIMAIIICLYFWHKKKPKFNKEFWKFGLSYSIPIIPHGISQIILSQFDRIMIREIVNDAAAGIYSFGYSISGICNTIISAIQTVYNPWFYEMMDLNTKESKNKIKVRSSQYAILLACFTGLVMLACPEILLIMGPEAYQEAKYASIPILLGGFFSSLYTIPASVEYYHKKTKCIATTTCTIAVLNIILNYIFIHKFGYIAAAYTTLFSYILYFVFHYCMATKIQKEDLFSKKNMFASAISAMVIGAFTLIFMDSFLLRLLLGLVVLAISIKVVIKFLKEK